MGKLKRQLEKMEVFSKSKIQELEEKLEAVSKQGLDTAKLCTQSVERIGELEEFCRQPNMKENLEKVFFVRKLIH